MNYDREEKELKELFSEMRREDERRVPSFAGTWQWAVSRAGKLRPRRRFFQWAAATALLTVLMGSVVILYRLSVNPRHSTKPSAPALSITGWRSPTEFLLRSPGDPWLKTVPLLGESIIEFQGMMPEKKN